MQMKYINKEMTKVLTKITNKEKIITILQTTTNQIKIIENKVKKSHCL
jgi:hypothetical protein